MELKLPSEILESRHISLSFNIQLHLTSLYKRHQCGGQCIERTLMLPPFDSRECHSDCLGTTTLLVRSTSFHLVVSICSFLCFVHQAGAQFAHCIACLIHCQVQITPCKHFIQSHYCFVFNYTNFTCLSQLSVRHIFSRSVF